MVSKRKHLDVARFFIDEPFKSKRPGRNSGVPGRDRNQHGSYLAGLYQNLINAYEQKENNKLILSQMILVFMLKLSELMDASSH